MQPGGGKLIVIKLATYSNNKKSLRTLASHKNSLLNETMLLQQRKAA